jgi:2-oxoglutarate ferredoxin oxidoreductase subunit alpha
MGDLNILIGGQAGQGLNIVQNLLISFFKKNDYYVFSSNEYMSRVRGGFNTITIRLSGERRISLKRDANILFTMSKGVMTWCEKEGRLTEKTVVLGSSQMLEDSIKVTLKRIPVNLNDIVDRVGNKIYMNTIIAGVIAGLLETDKNLITEVLKSIFKGKSTEIIENNKRAFFEGFAVGESLEDGKIDIKIKKDLLVKEMLSISGNDALSLGAIAGGCNFLSFYPMSPATSMALFFAKYAKKFGLVVEQFEDEISVINAAIGASYGGARSVVTTSGGGFDLMQEGISLSGMAQIPVVVHIAQRPGPSTGLPTRTMQSDFNLSLYAGHGEFPRIILSPGTIEEAYSLASKAFNLADKYQIPVFLLTDQYLVDTIYFVDKNNLTGEQPSYSYIKTDQNYKRYMLTESGISERGIPSYGTGVVLCNGNEHDEYGDTTEDEDYSRIMQEKRNKKLIAINNDVIKPSFIGSNAFEVLIYCWGSTYTVIKEAFDLLGDSRLAILHFSQVYPVHESSFEYFSKAKYIIGIEQNYNGQFGEFLKSKILRDIDKKILKYNGRAFYIEEIVEALKNFLGEKYGN